jgi:hypothetical protein
MSYRAFTRPPVYQVGNSEDNGASDSVTRNRNMCHPSKWRFVATLAVLLIGVADVRADPIPPWGPGPNAVGCSNIAQDFSRVASGNPQDYWEGNPNGNTPRYITDLLADPANTLTVNLAVPNDGGLYGPYVNQTHPYVVLVCYPTSAANIRPDYALPTGDVIPHMQTGSQSPVFADAAARYPVLLFSHGLSGSPISGEYINAIRVFASWGYVVVAPFHGDQRFADIKLDGFSDFVYAVIHIQTFIAMQAVRPLSLSLALDAVLTSPQFGAQFAGHVDASRIGGFGASLGGESLMLMAGAQLTNSIGQASKQVTLDPRLVTAVGYAVLRQDSLQPLAATTRDGRRDARPRSAEPPTRRRRLPERRKASTTCTGPASWCF